MSSKQGLPMSSIDSRINGAGIEGDISINDSVAKRRHMGFACDSNLWDHRGKCRRVTLTLTSLMGRYARDKGHYIKTKEYRRSWVNATSYVIQDYISHKGKIA